MAKRGTVPIPPQWSANARDIPPMEFCLRRNFFPTLRWKIRACGEAVFSGPHATDATPNTKKSEQQPTSACHRHYRV